MIRDHTNISGDVGLVVFDCLQLPTWWIITIGGILAQFPVRRSGFFDELRLFHVGLANSNKRFPLWRQQTGSGLLEQSLVCQTVRTYWASLKHKAITEKSRPTHKKPLQKQLPVCCRHGGFCLEMTAVALNSWNTASKHV